MTIKVKKSLEDELPVNLQKASLAKEFEATVKVFLKSSKMLRRFLAQKQTSNARIKILGELLLESDEDWIIDMVMVLFEKRAGVEIDL